MMDAREFCILAYIKWPGKQAAITGLPIQSEDTVLKAYCKTVLNKRMTSRSDYFPMQNLLKISPSTSSVEISPTIVPIL